jgi:uncharacterized protein YndB with AHSA1/START domain
MRRAEVGRTRDAGWQIGVSKTVDHSAEDLWSFLISPEGTAIWLGAGVEVLPEPGKGYETRAGVRGETRSVTEHRRIRLTRTPIAPPARSPQWTYCRRCIPRRAPTRCWPPIPVRTGVAGNG